MKSKLLLLTLFFLVATQMKANNMLVKNVTTMGNNATNKTIQVQFDMSWDNSWRDGINWDAAWVFMKYKDANGLWQHVQLNTTGFANGTGTANTIQVGSDKVGAFVYRSGTGTGTFSSTSMQLQWNYGLSGLTSVTGLEIRVFAVEMVYVPEGDFTIAPRLAISGFGCCEKYLTIYAPANNTLVINRRLSPILTYNNLTTSATVRIKGDTGIDTNNDGIVDNTTYPIGYNAFYCYKYEMTEQQYADFLNTLTASQITTLGVAGTSITLTNGQYFTSTPNKACGNSNTNRFLAYADWSGVRPMSVLEFNKALHGPLLAANNGIEFSMPSLIDVGFDPSYYGIMNFGGNAMEPCVTLNNYTFDNKNGDGILSTTGLTDITSWTPAMIMYVDQKLYFQIRNSTLNGFRYVRSAQ
jgi:hypothetical protein